MYCRTCCRTDGNRQFDINAISQVNEVRISDMLIYCLQIEITPYDMLPQTICEGCLSSLNSMFIFRKHSYHSDAKLRKMLTYSSPEHSSTAPNMELELSLLDASLSVQHFPADIIKIEADDPVVLNVVEQSSVAPDKSSGNHLNVIPDVKPARIKQTRSKQFECKHCDYKSSFRHNINRHQKNRNHIGWIITNSELSSSAPNMEIELNLREATLPVQKFPADIIKFEAEDPVVSNVVEQPTVAPDISSVNHLKVIPDVQPAGIRKTRSRQFECKHCDYKSSFKHNIIRHQQNRNHIGWVITSTEHIAKRKVVKLYECEQCEYKSPQKTNTTRHQQSKKHTGIRIIDLRQPQTAGNLSTDCGDSLNIR